jgi:hypothetical protein
VEELIGEFKNRGHTAGFMSCTIAILYFLTIYGLETIGSSTVWRPAFRGLLADYAYPVRSNVKANQLPGDSLTLRLARDYLLGRILTLSWAAEGSGNLARSHQQSLLSNAAARLAHPILGARREMDLCSPPIWVSSYAALLL